MAATSSPLPQLDLQLAWRRVQTDLADRVFVTPGTELELIESDLGDWIGTIAAEIDSGRGYRPKVMRVAEVPKGGGLLRPGSQLALADHLVYSACVGAALEQIHALLGPQQGTVDFGYRLSRSPNEARWISKQFNAWRDFRLDSVAKIDDGAQFVVITDITACYETIAVPFLLSDLRAAGVSAEITHLLNVCLSRWATHGRGIPQGVSASDILAKVYLNSVDRALIDDGIVHSRYVDDIRLFCANSVSAKRQLNTLVTLLRRRGLSVQSAKTKILDAEAARRKIDGAVRTVTEVGEQFIEEMMDLVPEGYFNWSALSQALADNPESPPVEILVAAYQRHFADPFAEHFDATFFRFLLARLGKAQNETPLTHGLASYFVTHPEETGNITGYLEAIGDHARSQDLIATFLESEDAVYPYQRYLLLRWLEQGADPLSDRLMAIIRRNAFSSEPKYLKAVCRRVMGNQGTTADLERLELAYDTTDDDVERAELVYCLRRVEVGRRNGFLAKVEADGPMTAKACGLAKRWRRPAAAPKAATPA